MTDSFRVILHFSSPPKQTEDLSWRSSRLFADLLQWTAVDDKWLTAPSTEMIEEYRKPSIYTACLFWVEAGYVTFELFWLW